MRPLLCLSMTVCLAQAQSPCSIVLEPREVRPGESVLLTWDAPRSPRIRLEPGGMILPGRYQVTLRPGYTTTYRIFDASPGGGELAHAEAKVTPGMPLGEPARICSFDASTQAVLPGEPVVLKWECAGSAKVRLEPGGMELDGKSEIIVTPQENTRYTITASNAAGGQSRTLEVAVLGRLTAASLPPPAPVCTFTASRQVVRLGEQVELRWSCQGNARVRLDPGGLELDGNSSIAVVPDRTTVYTLSVTSLLGGSSRSLEVRVEEARRVLTEKDLESFEEAIKPLDQMDLGEALHRGEALREAAPEGSWTLRMVISGSASGLKQVARAAGPRATEVMILPYLRKDGLRFWQGCFGVYPTQAAALKAWRSAPEALRKVYDDALPQRLKKPMPKP